MPSKYNPTKIFCIILMFLGLGNDLVLAQINQPKKLRIGTSLGAGGLYLYGGVSLDVAWRGFSLHYSPGIYYISGGICQKIGYFQKSRRVERPLILSLNYHDDYFLSIIQNEKLPRYDRKIFMGLLGVRNYLDNFKEFYYQISLGMMYVRELDFNSATRGLDLSQHYFPMIELRFSGEIPLYKRYSKPRENRGFRIFGIEIKFKIKRKNKGKSSGTKEGGINEE